MADFTGDKWGREDILDSRDIIERLDELEESESALTEAVEELKDTEEAAMSTADAIATARNTRNDASDAFPIEEREELATLREIASEGEGSPDWQYGETLILDSYFKEYAQQLAEDIGAVPDNNAQWPLYCIDWEQAARDLKHDYYSIDVDGSTYWIRA